jgi:1-acyl-sn-glycerol-3-phosphate acyltransferase
VPVVPVTLPYNWKMFPDDGKFLLRGKTLNIVIHKAIDTFGLEEKDVPELRERVFNIIQTELFAKNQDLFS